MPLYQIVVSEVQRNRSLEVFELFAESQRQTGQTAHVQPRRCVQPFNVACRNKVHVRRTRDGPLIHGNKCRRTILQLWMLRMIVFISLDDLAEVNDQSADAALFFR